MFTVCLPLRAVYTSSTKPEALTTLLRNEVKSLKGVRALVVDDEQEVRILLTLTLEQYGANTEAVSSGKEALEALTSREPDEQFHVLICDIGMPDEDGYTVIRKVRSLPAEKGGAVPAIALTGYGSVQHRMRALEAGFQTYAVKPVDPDELVVGIKGLIRDIDPKAR
jgi:CheY-like chemotaxis protein